MWVGPWLGFTGLEMGTHLSQASHRPINPYVPCWVATYAELLVAALDRLGQLCELRRDVFACVEHERGAVAINEVGGDRAVGVGRGDDGDGGDDGGGVALALLG